MKSTLRNSSNHYGWVTIFFHWSMAVALIGLYFLGDYMVDLDYYDTWYHKAPAYHKAAGIVLGIMLIMRIIWNLTQKKPKALEKKHLLIWLGKIAHRSLYLLTLLLIISGYLISTAKGQGVDMWGVFEVPAVLPDSVGRGEAAGKVHTVLGTLFIITVALHTLAALVHHFILKDRTLTRMLWVKNSKKA